MSSTTIRINTKDFTDPCIKIVCNDEVIKEISNILSLTLNNNRFIKHKNGVYEIRPVCIKKRYQTLGKNGRDKKYKYLIDFKNSDSFYACFDKSEAKIAYDEFSFQRAEVLYGYFFKIETQWRNIILRESISVDELNKYLQDKPSKKGPDSLCDFVLSRFELNDFLSIIFACDSNNTQRIAQKSGLIISGRTANTIKNIRNACMHFRVITPKDYNEIMKTIIFYYKFQNTTDLMKTMLGLSKE